jgi:tetraacyldisaccharide 4'-kinase
MRKAWRVRLDEPFWWYRQGPSSLAASLQPIGALYGWAVAARYFRAKPYRSELPIICVGNFTAGGTGKTPLVIHLCEHLEAAGHEPVALTRGYGGRLPGPYWVNADTDRASDVGDEALLLARAAPTLVARDRRAGARAIEVGPHPVTVIVMDDGLQNPGLAKDLTITVVDGLRGIGNGLVMPAGPLRAALEFQLELTDAIVVNENAAAADGGAVTDWLRRRFAGPVLRAKVLPPGGAAWLRGARVVAWAGIGAPQRFFVMLEHLGAELTARVPFRDHQPLGEADARQVLALAERHGAMPVTTEKDMARITGFAGACAELARTSRVVPVRLALAEPDAERLDSLVASALKSRRG